MFTVGTVGLDATAPGAPQAAPVVTGVWPLALIETPPMALVAVPTLVAQKPRLTKNRPRLAWQALLGSPFGVHRAPESGTNDLICVIAL